MVTSLVKMIWDKFSLAKRSEGWLASGSLAHESGERRLVSLTFASWNLMGALLRQIAGLRRAA